jgi:hypothetical protein
MRSHSAVRRVCKIRIPRQVRSLAADAHSLEQSHQAFPSVIVAELIETVPPLEILDAKFKLPDPTAASPSIITVPTPPPAEVFIRNEAGVPVASAAAAVIAENVSRPADGDPATGFEHARLASFVPGSALNVPPVLPAGAPVKISRKAVVPSAVVSAAIRVLRTVS